VPEGATGDVLLHAMDDLVAPAVEAFAPTWLLVSAGFDGHRAGIKVIGDLLGHRTLESTCVYLRLQTGTLRDVALPLPAPVTSIVEGAA